MSNYIWHGTSSYLGGKAIKTSVVAAMLKDELLAVCELDFVQ